MNTLEELALFITQHPDQESVIVEPHEWERLVCLVPGQSWRIVPGTNTFPPFFWFLDKKIVTPRYKFVETYERSLKRG